MLKNQYQGSKMSRITRFFLICWFKDLSFSIALHLPPVDPQDIVVQSGLHVGRVQVLVWLNSLSTLHWYILMHIQGVFCDCCPPKKFKYVKLRLGESTST